MTNSFFSALQTKLALQDEKHLYRQRPAIDKREGSVIQIANNTYLNFCSNDYLGLSIHPAVKKAFAEQANVYGLGSTAAPHVAGHTKAHQLLEMEFAEFLNQEKALLFNSGYHANLGVIMTLANKNTAIIADKFCHASIIDGALLSRANLGRYHHNNAEHAESLVSKTSAEKKLLITESVFSMHGNVAKLNEIAGLAAKYQAMLMIDDAHGIGVIGTEGKGASTYFALSSRNTVCFTAALGKALGSMGAIVYGHPDIIESLLQFARTYRYSTALPPAVCAATRVSLQTLKRETWRQAKLHALCQFFIKEAIQRTLPLISTDITPIKSILIGQNKKAVHIQQKLMLKGLFVSCIRPPSVPAGGALIRISLTCHHEEAQLLYLLDQLAEIVCDLCH